MRTDEDENDSDEENEAHYLMQNIV